MITTRLLGGLGNQMFQYAFGRAMALKNNTKLCLDLSELIIRDDRKEFTFRDFELNVFNIKYDHKTTVRLKTDLLSKIKRRLFLKVVDEKGQLNFQPGILQNRGNLLLIGFWQTELYFKEIADIIRLDFEFKSLATGMNAKLLEKIKSQNSVSIHFRKGDYVTIKGAHEVYGSLTHQYYLNAIAYIKKNVTNPHFYIFSDDVNWVKQNFVFVDNHMFIDHNEGEKSYEDLRLMQHCKHNIIANSTFSWWAAWLNSNISKIVIAPEQWMINKEIDIVPSTWVRF